jgi:hypothetical protein
VRQLFGIALEVIEGQFSDSCGIFWHEKSQTLFRYFTCLPFKHTFLNQDVSMKNSSLCRAAALLMVWRRVCGFQQQPQ